MIAFLNAMSRTFIRLKASAITNDIKVVESKGIVVVQI